MSIEIKRGEEEEKRNTLPMADKNPAPHQQIMKALIEDSLREPAKRDRLRADQLLERSKEISEMPDSEDKVKAEDELSAEFELLTERSKQRTRGMKWTNALVQKRKKEHLRKRAM